MLKRGTSRLPENSPPFTYGNASAQRGSFAVARSSIFVFMARNISPITSCVFDESRALICSIVAVNRPVAVEDVGVLGEEAEDQPRHEMVHVVAASACPTPDCP